MALILFLYHFILLIFSLGINYSYKFSLGTFWNVSNAVMGLTFLGWANNVGDFVADLTIAKEGQSRCAFSAAFAGPPLYLLASVGLACFVTSAANGFVDIPINIQNVEIVLYIR